MAIGRLLQARRAMRGSGETHPAGAGLRPGRRFSPLIRPGRSPISVNLTGSAATCLSGCPEGNTVNSRR